MEKKDFKAINVTIPYKEKVIPYIDFDDFNNRIDNEVDEYLIFEHDNVPAFEFIDIPSFDLGGLIFAGKVGGARNNRKKKRSS